ncbi:DNA methyltransferase [Salinisphaera sp. PC39]|uniref:endonuclease domain-containing protein n=1 Tax=Salinisphaera sp. PC39 TaxID=1304156 RepID=UPI003340CF01
MNRFARRLRREQTDAENRLWCHRRARRLEGYKFRRQHPLGRYIVDFVCLEAELIVELDGGQHAEQTRAYDAARTAALESHGFRVIRFWNDEVLRETEAVLACIREHLVAGDGSST